MKTFASYTRWLVPVAAAWLTACESGEVTASGLTVIPPEVTLPPGGRQAFAASPPTVIWSVRGGDAGGTITPSGLYTAPGNPGTYTVEALEPTSSMTAVASVTVAVGQGSTTHGMSIPTVHPRLWYDADRLARARTWYASHPFSPSGSDYIGRATRGLLADDAAQCRAAIDWALAATTSDFPVPGGVSCDNCRWIGESVILTYDWCHAFMTPTERATFIAETNEWMNNWRTKDWGGPHMPENNYAWGNIRNELEWAITSYEDNIAMAETFLDDVFTNRLAGNFYPAALPGGVMSGGIGREGSQYGIYIAAYAAVPFATASLLGRDLMGESNYWREAAYHLIYSLSPSPTSGSGAGQATSMDYTFYPYSDDELWLYGGQVGANAATYMMAVALRWPNANVGQHARRWLEMTGRAPHYFAQSVDPGGTALAFTGLPLDYYGSGAGMLYGRSAWGSPATTFHWHMKDGPDNGHSHADWGTWQIWRNGRYLSRETVSYGESVAGYGGVGSTPAALPIGHNSLLVNGAGNRDSQWISGLADVTRLESQPAYAFAAVDLTDTSNNAAFVRWGRDFVFVRGLETMVILDRIESSTVNATKTFLAHCETNPTAGANTATCTNGTQALVMTTLVPATSTYRVVAEGGAVGQYRIEVDTTPDTAQSYILTVLQAKDAGASSLSPTVVEDGTSFTLQLNGSNSITFVKGMVSTGGSITTGGGTTSFRADVQPMTVTDAGPAWN